MSALLKAGNEALELNPPHGLDIHITDHGSDWLWTVFSIMGSATVLYTGYTYFKPPHKRSMYYNTIGTVFSSMFAYFTMASNLGWTGVQAEFNHVTVSDPSETPGIRQVFYAQWVAYFFAFSFTVANSCLSAQVEWMQSIFNVGATMTFVVSFLVGTLIHSTYKWGYFTFGTFAYLVVVFDLFTVSRSAATEEARPTYTMFAGVVSFLWMLYPICFGLSEGGNVIQPDSQTVFYGILDICLFVIYPCWFSFSGSKFAPKLDFHREKNAEPAPEQYRASGETQVEPQV